MPRVSIELLADHSGLSGLVGRWHWDQWGSEDPDGSAEAWSRALESRASRGELPTVWVAFHDDTPVGSVVLTEKDAAAGGGFNPWLEGLYVVPAYRGRGVGRRLILTCETSAAALGCRTLYLHTVIPAFYARYGWAELPNPRTGSPVVVMARTLAVGDGPAGLV